MGKKLKSNKLNKYIFIIAILMFIFMLKAPSANATVYSGNIVPGSGGSGNIVTSSYGLSGSAGDVFDGNPNTWVEGRSFDFDGNAIFTYQFPTPRSVTKLVLKGIDDEYYYVPKNFTFEGYNETENKWDVLISNPNVTDYNFYEGTFNNTKSYRTYRLNVTGWILYVQGSAGALSEIEMYETLSPAQPSNLQAVAGNAKVDLSWDAADKATQYNIKRATSPNGPYNTVATSVYLNYTDTTVHNGTTYYYKVSGLNSAGEGPDSNYAQATPDYPDIYTQITGSNITYIQGFDFATPKTVTKIKFNLNNIENAILPTSYSIEGYNDITSQWESISSNGTVAFGSNELTLNNTKSYNKYRLNLNFNSSSAVSLTISAVYGY